MSHNSFSNYLGGLECLTQQLFELPWRSWMSHNICSNYFGGLGCRKVLFKVTLEVSSSRKSKDCIQPSSKCVQLVELHKDLYQLFMVGTFFTNSQINLVAKADANCDGPADCWCG